MWFPVVRFWASGPSQQGSSVNWDAPRPSMTWELLGPWSLAAVLSPVVDWGFLLAKSWEGQLCQPCHCLLGGSLPEA